MLKGIKSVDLKIIQMYHFRLKLVGLQLFWSGTPTFSYGTPTFCQVGSVPIHVELRVIHSEIVIITHTF